MRVLREIAAQFAADDGLVFADDGLPVFSLHLDIGVEAVVFLGDLQNVLEQVMVEAKHHVGIHLDEAAVAIPSKARIARGAGKALHRLVIEAKVEHGVHHAGHRNPRA